MKSITFIALLLFGPSLFAQIIEVDLKLSEVNPDSTQARFFKGEAAYGLSEVFATVTCWGGDGNRINLEFEKKRKQVSAEFSTLSECRKAIKQAKGFIGINFGEMRFKIDTRTRKVISFKRI